MVSNAFEYMSYVVFDVDEDFSNIFTKKTKQLPHGMGLYTLMTHVEWHSVLSTNNGSQRVFVCFQFACDNDIQTFRT